MPQVKFRLSRSHHVHPDERAQGNSLIRETNTPALALGIHCGHDAAAALCSPDGVVCVIQEERLQRIKHYYGFPKMAVLKVLEWSGVSTDDLTLVAFSSRSIFYPEHSNLCRVEADGVVHTRESLKRQGLLSLAFLDELPPDEADGRLRAYTHGYCLNKVRATLGEFAPRHFTQQRQWLRDLGLMRRGLPHWYIHHHRAHAAAAFRAAGLSQACVLSMDGKGDGLSAAVYLGSADGSMRLVRSTPAKDSLGSFYQAATEALGFIPVDGEYKTMGLAAFGGRRRGPNPFAGMVAVRDGRFVAAREWTFRSFNAANPDKAVPNPLNSVAQCEEFKRMLETTPPEEFAGAAQAVFEQAYLEFHRQAMTLTGVRSLATSGGCALNVKANALVRDVLAPEAYYVHPDAGDSGLALGAALEALYQAGLLARGMPFRSCYLGHAWPEAEARDQALAWAGRRGARVEPASPGRLATHLAQGKVVGVFQGRMEMGPRALGNRSVLADPRNPAIRDRINALLKGREPFTPFAPVVLAEEAGRYWTGGAEYPYMTFTVAATDHARAAAPAVVHVDGTMRPQTVGMGDNPPLRELLTAFKELTGEGVLLNTSFNRHGLPIAASPQDALNHLENGWVDAVCLGGLYLEPPP